MNRARIVRLLALTSMTLVTAWSVWAWAQAGAAPLPMERGPHTHGAGSAQAGVPAHAASAHAAAAAAHAAPAHGAAAAPEAVPEEPESETPGPINWTEFGSKTPPFAATLINFAILAAGYYFLGRKGITEGLKSRRDAISKEIDEAQAMKHEAEARAKTYQAKLATLEEEVRAARDALIRSGEAEREPIVKEADAKAERMRKDAEFMVAQELKQIRLDLWREAVEAAVVTAEALLKERVSADDQERLAEDYLKGFAKPIAGGSSGLPS
jgi:F-type H+-transporting ATPase subunit b